MSRTTKQMERRGVNTVEDVFTEMGWAFREQDVADQGIDAQVEVDGLTAAPTGRLLAVQIKCGPSYFARPTENGWRYVGKSRHLSYWLAHLMPVILVLVDADSRTGYWVHVTYDAVQFTDRGWWIEVPAAQVLDISAHAALSRLALDMTPAVDPVEQALPALPPSVVAMLPDLAAIDRDGALRLARYLTEGRDQPRATVTALLDTHRTWTHATAQRLVTIGAYANDHGHRDLAIRAFALASDQNLAATGLRQRAIAVLLALSTGDRARADALLGSVREQGGTSLLAAVAVHAFDTDEPGLADTLETLLVRFGDEQLEEEPTCLVFLAERAFARSDLDQALELYERARRRYPQHTGARLGTARVLIERAVRCRSVMPYRDQQAARELATTVRDEMRQWSGPSENAQRIIVQERMLAQAFAEVIVLATPVTGGGGALEREAADPIVAADGAKASIALGDRARADQFVQAAGGTPAEPLLQAIAADPGLPRDQTVALWRAALDTAGDATAVRASLYQLATLGALAEGELSRVRPVANLDEEDRIMFTARNIAAAGDLGTAVTLLRQVPSPAAGEILAEVLRVAGRFVEALTVCDETWSRFGALKALQDKVNILAASGDLDGAEACAAQLLATKELPDEHRRQLHGRLIDRRAALGDWAGMQARSRAALQDQPEDHEHQWALIYAQINQGHWNAAWESYRQLRPEVSDPGLVRAWVELHLRFELTPQARALATALAARFAGDAAATAQLARLGGPLS